MSNITVDNPYELVSSFYGPGATGCWYLTILSCFVSWTFHPRKRASDSIDSDFVAVIVFSVVAAGHSIIQTEHLQTISDATEKDLGAAHLVRMRASLKASVAIVHASTATLLGSIIPVAFRGHVRRSILLQTAAIVNIITIVALSSVGYYSWGLPIYFFLESILTSLGIIDSALSVIFTSILTYFSI